jgi:hypothetical protein
MQVSESSNAKLIVCERTGRWAVALRRELTETGVRVWETRTLADCRDELVENPASFVVVELGANVERVLRLLASQQRRFPAARVAVVAERSQADYDSLLREAGAVHVVCSPRHVGLLARLACRHLAEAPAPQQSLAERIWTGLPWA